MFGSSFRARQSARLGEKHIAGIHKHCHLVRESQSHDIGVSPEILHQLRAQLGIVPAHHNHFDPVSELLENFLNRVLQMPESHTPGHHQEPFLLRVHIAELQYALVPHLRSVSLRIVENGLHRDAIRT